MEEQEERRKGLFKANAVNEEEEKEEGGGGRVSPTLQVGLQERGLGLFVSR